MFPPPRLQPGVRVAAGRAAARITAADPPALLPAAAQVLSGLMGPDQATEVARQALLATRRMAEHITDPLTAGDAATSNMQLLEAQWPVLVPPMCALVMSTSGPVKATCERSLSKVLGLVTGLDGAHRYLAAGECACVAGRLGTGVHAWCMLCGRVEAACYAVSDLFCWQCVDYICVLHRVYAQGLVQQCALP